MAAVDEAADVVGQHRRVAIGIDRDHRHVDAVGVVAELAQRRAQVGHRRRADVGAVGVAEVHDEQAGRLGAELERLTAPAHVGQGDRVDLRRRLERVADELASPVAPARRERDYDRDKDAATATARGGHGPTVHGDVSNSRM